MSIITDYKQYMRRYRLLITSQRSSTVATRRVISKPENTSSSPWIGTLNTNSVNIRKGPSKSHKSYGWLNKGDKLTIYDKANGWLTVAYEKGENGRAYIMAEFVDEQGRKQNAPSAPIMQEDSVTTIDATTIDVSELRCKFYCVKCLDDTPNFSHIVVYNMNPSTIGSIKEGDKVILEAGYVGGNYGMIFTGQVVQPIISNEGGTDIVLTIICQDGDTFLTSAFTMTTIGKGATQSDIVKACAQMNGDDMATGILSNKLTGSKLPRGKVLFGKSASYLKKIAAGNSSQFYIEDGKINIVSASDYDPNTAVELNPNTGLIGTPSQTDDGVSGQCLINPSIKLNTMIHINASLIAAKQVSQGETSPAGLNADGMYRIVKLVYEGDTRGDPWYCTFEAITQSGAKPDGLIGDATNPWR